MSVLDESTRSRITTMVSDVLEVEPDELSDADLFREDHGADSLSIVDIAMSLERAFNIKISATEVKRMKSLNDTYDLVAESLPREAGRTISA